ARLAMLRDRLNAAEDAVVGATAIDRVCLTRQMRPDRARNPVFNLGGGNADDRSGILLASRQRRPRHIVSPAPPALGRMARAHPVSAIIVELAREEGMVIRLGNPPCPRLALKLLLDPVPGLRLDDRRMKAVVDLPFVAQPSDIDRVRQ